MKRVPRFPKLSEPPPRAGRPAVPVPQERRASRHCAGSLAIREKTLGPEHPDVAASLENYAKLLRKMKNAAEAVQMEARAKAIREKATK